MWLRRSWYSFRPLKPTAWVEGDRRWRVSTGRIDTRAIAESVVTPAVSEADRKALYRLNNNLPSHASRDRQGVFIYASIRLRQSGPSLRHLPIFSLTRMRCWPYPFLYN